MDKRDIQIYNERYNSYLNQYGFSPQALGWGKNGRQEIRFSVSARHILTSETSSVLDVGCGFADLYSFLSRHNWKGKYTGVDIVDSLLQSAREKNPSLELMNMDIVSAEELGQYDYVVSNGIFNAKLKYNDNYEHINTTLSAMFSHAKIAVICDFMSSYVDFSKEGAWHSDPAKIIEIVKKLTKRFILYYDYMPYEFTVVLFKDDSKSENNIFNVT